MSGRSPHTPDTAQPPGPAARVLVWAVRAYQRRFSGLKPVPTCRFSPSCSEYAVQALTAHGALRGGGMALWRVLRCNPLSPGGHDPVPPRRPR